MKEKMKKLDALANAANDAKSPEMKKIWTDKWYQLVIQYAAEIRIKVESEAKKAS